MVFFKTPKYTVCYLELHLRGLHSPFCLSGHTVYYRLPSGSWEEVSIPPSAEDGASTTLLTSLPCGTTLHIYGTSWNK